MTQTPAHDICAVGNAIVDVLAPCDPAFLEAQGLTPGSMQLVDAGQSAALYAAMAAGVEASGGSAGNTVAGVGSLGGRAAYIGKVADDTLGQVFTHDIRAAGVAFDTPPLVGGADQGLGTGSCMINVTPDGQRTMCTFLGAANQLTVDDIDPALIGASAIVYLEGYLFDPAPARAAFEAAAAAAHAAGRKVAITLSDTFVGPAGAPSCSTSSNAPPTSCWPTRPSWRRCSSTRTSTTPPPCWRNGSRWPGSPVAPTARW